MNRREFVIAGTVSLSAVPLLERAQAGMTAAGTLQVPLDARSILYDRRFAASCTFGAEMARRGGSVRAIDGDVTALWCDELAPRWARGERRRRDDDRTHALVPRAARLGPPPARNHGAHAPMRTARAICHCQHACRGSSRPDGQAARLQPCHDAPRTQEPMRMRLPPGVCERFQGAGRVRAGRRCRLGVHERRRRRSLPRRVLTICGRARGARSVQRGRTGVHGAGPADRPHRQSLPGAVVHHLDRQESRLRRLGADALRQRRARSQAHEPHPRGQRGQRLRTGRAGRQLLRSVPLLKERKPGLDRCPDPGWGSVLGNAIDRGGGYTAANYRRFGAFAA